VNLRWSEDHLLLAVLFPICSLAGLAAALRSGRPPSRIEMVSAILNSGLFGVAIAAILLNQFGWQTWRLVFGLSVLSGLGGNVLLVFVLSLFQRIIQSYAQRRTNDKE
jgi:uncharacterized membrane protein YeaQ/YmgE (transglycosylase-associated protein family)